MATIASTAAGNYFTGATWVGGVVPGIGDTAKFMHVVTLDASGNVGGIDPTGTGVLVGSNPSFRLLVGDGGRPQYLAHAVVV